MAVIGLACRGDYYGRLWMVSPESGERRRRTRNRLDSTRRELQPSRCARLRPPRGGSSRDRQRPRQWRPSAIDRQRARGARSDSVRLSAVLERRGASVRRCGAALAAFCLQWISAAPLCEWLAPGVAPDAVAPVRASTFTPDADGTITLIEQGLDVPRAVVGVMVTAEPGAGGESPSGEPILTAYIVVIALRLIPS